MNSVSPSFHSFDWRSNVRGVEATVKLATAAPDGVNRSSGSLVRLPMIVMMVSPAMRGVSGAVGSCGRRGRHAGELARVGTDSLVRSTTSLRLSWRSSSLAVAGSAVMSTTA